MTKVLTGLAAGGFLAALLVALASMWMLPSPRDGPPLDASNSIVQSMHADTHTSGILQSNEGPVEFMDRATMSLYDTYNHESVTGNPSTIFPFSDGPPGYLPEAFQDDINALPNSLDGAHPSFFEFQFASPLPNQGNGVLSEVVSSPAIFTSWVLASWTSGDEALGSHLPKSLRLEVGSGVPLFLLFGVILALIVVVPFRGTSGPSPSQLLGSASA